MKYKFYEKPEGIDYTDQNDFKEEIHFLSQIKKISKSKIEIDGCHPVGEYVIFIGNQYAGYLDDDFYRAMIFNEEWV